MILVTGGTGFIGRALISHLVSMNLQVRLLLKPSPKSPKIPLGVPVEVAVCSFKDERGLRAAMRGVDVVFHLAGAEHLGSHADLNGVDVEGTAAVAKAVSEAGIDRILYLSHLGADKASAYPVLKAKALAEGSIISSGVDYTIIRSAVVFGKNDHFTSSIKRLIYLIPFFFVLPGDGSTIIQPVWILDLVTCLGLALQDNTTRNQTILLGGSEYFSFRQAVDIILNVTNKNRPILSMYLPYLRFLSLIAEQIYPRFPMSIYWLDYLAADRICETDSMPRQFGIIPARFNHQNMAYLKAK
jgi:uncharacterized protein YbjT (DUF2867 family)